MKNTLRPKKRFGQNFLRDQTVIDRIVGAVGINASAHVVEIGPGQGALTDQMVDGCKRIDVIEIDRDLAPYLLASHGLKDQFHLHNVDALEFDFSTLTQDPRSLRIVGNLPYNISTPLIFQLLQYAHLIRDMHLMLQREVVERLAASPGGKTWGRLGVMAQYYCEVESILDVPPEAFDPPPAVQSAVVRMLPKTAEMRPACNPATLKNVVQKAFAHRRKTLRNNFKGYMSQDTLESLSINPQARAETLSLEQFVSIANAADAHPQNRSMNDGH